MWRDEFFAIAASSKPPAANSRRPRRGTGCAAVPHPSTQLPPRKTARSDVLTIEMSVPEARPPTAPESWLLSGISSPPWDRSRHNLTPNIPGGIRRGLHTGHRPGTAPLPVGSHRGPPRSSPHTITHRQIECLSQADSTDTHMYVCMYVCSKVKNSQARTGHQRGMGGRKTEGDP